MKKLVSIHDIKFFKGINLNLMVEQGVLVYIDLFDSPFDSNAFDNLPLSLSTPSTYTDKIPKGFQKHQLSSKQNNNMCHQNLKKLMAKLDKYLSNKDVTLIIDSYDSLVAGLDSN